MSYFSKPFLKKTIFSGFVFILLLVIVELILSWLKIFPDDYYTMTPNSGFTWVINPEEIVGIEENSEIYFDALGARSTSNIEEKTNKIAVFGGSTTACFALTQNKTWTALLEKKLGNSYWIGNFGRPGNSSNHHILQFEHILTKPKLKDVKTVLIMQGINDFVGCLVSSEKYLHSTKKEIESIAFQHTPLNEDLPFRQKSTLYRLLHKAKNKIKLYFSRKEYLTKTANHIKSLRTESVMVDSLPNLTEGLKHYQKNTEDLIAMAKAKNIQLIFITQATMWKPNLEDKYETLMLTSGFENNEKFYTTEALYHGMELFNERTISICKANKIPYIELHLPKTTESFYDDFHFNESGAKLAAKQIAQSLKEML